MTSQRISNDALLSLIHPRPMLVTAMLLLLFSFEKAIGQPQLHCLPMLPALYRL